MRNLLKIFLLFLVFTSCIPERGPVRFHGSFNGDWKFILADSSAFATSAWDDRSWRSLGLPHDWSIEGSFSKDHPAGTGGGALPGGIGWYRKHFHVPEADTARKVFITFDGIYQNSEVFINGQLLGKRPNGYISFRYDLTPWLNFGEDNVIAVRVDNGDQPNSRWYSGSGIYRNVWLTKTHPVHVAHWGSHVRTPEVSDERAVVELELTLVNESDRDRELRLETILLDAGQKKVAMVESSMDLSAGAEETTLQQLEVQDPELWDVDHPHLYTAHTRIFSGSDLLDEYETILGIRSFRFDADSGFILNGEQVKIKGVCMHHDLGALGAAFNYRARERQLEILKAMGCNGIRTSHNPPEPELLELCDRMGFIVQNETFDVWRRSKVENDYSRYFDQWHEQDLTDHLKRDRNHPSIFSWSIGNEILEQWDSSGTRLAARLATLAREYIPDIPLTGGFNDPEPHNFIIQSGEMDLIGFNYKHERFEAFPETFPGGCFIATETTSSLNSRGEYDMPSDSIRRWPLRWDIPFYDGMRGNRCSSYDNCSAPWGSTHAESWKLVKKHNFLSGMYIWTGFDYLGEPTPYQWPSRSSYFGIVDLAGFPKDAYYMYMSEWTDQDVLHLFPHWNWDPGQEVDVWAYTSFDEVELFLNGRSLGRNRKGEDDLHLQWNVTFEEGELKAVGRKADGTIMEKVIRTAGEAARIQLVPDREMISADGQDLCFVTVSILDAAGNPVPRADNLVEFTVEGDIRIAGVDNGDQVSHAPFQASSRKAYNGKCLVILKAGREAGAVRLKARSKGLQSTELQIELTD